MSPSILRFIKSPYPSQPKLPCEAPKFVILSTILGDVPRRFEGYWTLLQPRIKNFRPLDKHVAFPLHFLRVAMLPGIAGLLKPSSCCTERLVKQHKYVLLQRPNDVQLIRMV